MFSGFRALRFRQIARGEVFFFKFARSRCHPSLFFRNQRVLRSSSVPIISLVSAILCAFCFLQVQVCQRIPVLPICQSLAGRTSPFIVWLPTSQPISQIHSRFRRVFQSWSKKKKKKQEPPCDLSWTNRSPTPALVLLPVSSILWKKSTCVCASPSSVQPLRVYSSCHEPASIQVFASVPVLPQQSVVLVRAKSRLCPSAFSVSESALARGERLSARRRSHRKSPPKTSSTAALSCRTSNVRHPNLSLIIDANTSVLWSQHLAKTNQPHHPQQ